MHPQAKTNHKCMRSAIKTEDSIIVTEKIKTKKNVISIFKSDTFFPYYDSIFITHFLNFLQKYSFQLFLTKCSANCCGMVSKKDGINACEFKLDIAKIWQYAFAINYFLIRTVGNYLFFPYIN